MNNSSFGENSDFYTLTDIIPLETQGATSDACKVRISGKWHFMKKPKKEFSDHPLYIAAFKKEFDIGYTLDHPNIVRYISQGKSNEGFYFLTEYVDGNTLTDFLCKNSGYFEKKENVRKFIKQLFSALKYLHTKQILHLDLKPDNILITSIGNNVKIVDLGFAYNDCWQYLTVGKTNLYAAPEQFYNDKVDERTDIYGIGMLLLYVFTQSTDRSLIKNIPNPYKLIVRKCLDENKEKRFGNIASIESEIEKQSRIKKYNVILSLSFLLIIAVVSASYFRSGSLEFVAPENTLTEPTPGAEVVTFIPLPEQKENIHIQENIPGKEIVREQIKPIINPAESKLEKDLFTELQQRSKQELQQIYQLPEPVTYSLKDQVERINQTRTFYKQLTDTIKNAELLNKSYVMFWDEQKNVFTPYFQKQTLAFLDEAKKQIIPDSITQKKMVYRLIDKKTADLFIPFVRKNQTVTTNEQKAELNRIAGDFEQMKKEIYRQYQHLFESETDFEKEYNKYNSFTVSHIDDWINLIFR